MCLSAPKIPDPPPPPLPPPPSPEKVALEVKPDAGAKKRRKRAGILGTSQLTVPVNPLNIPK